MSVKKIIEAKRIQKVITVKPGDTIKSVTGLLAQHRIGAVIVSEDGAIVDGILSERDIVRALGTLGAACMTRLARDLMTASVIGCHLEDTANSVMEKMTDGRFRHMPVIQDNRLVGVISIGDVVKARLAEIENENSALTGMIANSW